MKQKQQIDSHRLKVSENVRNLKVAATRLQERKSKAEEVRKEPD